MATTTDYANLSADVYNTVPNGTPARQYRELGRTGGALIEQQYSLDHTVPQFLSLLEKVTSDADPLRLRRTAGYAPTGSAEYSPQECFVAGDRGKRA